MPYMNAVPKDPALSQTANPKDLGSGMANVAGNTLEMAAWKRAVAIGDTDLPFDVWVKTQRPAPKPGIIDQLAPSQ